MRAGAFSLALAMLSLVVTPAIAAQSVDAQAPRLDARSQRPALVDSIRLDSGRITVVATRRDERLARAIRDDAVLRDTFPGLPRVHEPVLILVAPDAAHFRSWVGASAPEWGAAVAFPKERRIIMQGSYGASDAGNPLIVLRHELAHLALHEALGDLAPRWFDEGYASFAAGEWSRSAALETSMGMTWRALPNGDELEAGFAGGAERAEWTYALSHLAVAELADIDRTRGLANFFAYWKRSGSYEVAMREAFGMTGSGFDSYWHRQVRNRYGAFAFVADLSAIFALFGVLLGPLFWARRRRDRRRLEAMREADRVHEAAARASALEALLAVTSDEPGGVIGGLPGSLEGDGPRPAAGSLDTIRGHP